MKIGELRSVARVACALLGILATPVVALNQQAQASATDVSALAKASQNPVGDLIAVPFQFNFNTGGDLGDRSFYKNVECPEGSAGQQLRFQVSYLFPREAKK